MILLVCSTRQNRPAIEDLREAANLYVYPQNETYLFALSTKAILAGLA
jgi:hypothetical protein